MKSEIPFSYAKALFYFLQYQFFFNSESIEEFVKLFWNFQTRNFNNYFEIDTYYQLHLLGWNSEKFEN